MAHLTNAMILIDEAVQLLAPRDDEADLRPAIATLLWSAVVGADPKTISQVGGIDGRRLRAFNRRLRAAGIWFGDAVDSDEWSSPAGAIALTMDAMVATGELRRLNPQFPYVPRLPAPDHAIAEPETTGPMPINPYLRRY